ncbi:MAG: ribosomal protein S18-alanine N-acetyltransferase [Beijerinckiaceae bacterium]|nr:ribosomal protein S18-alanine N-acetyltransferase [Beijerinckiaceae bacterium]
MFFRRSPRVLVRPLDASDSQSCASIHAACFAHSWPASEIEAMAASSNISALSAIDGRSDDLLGFVISRIVLDEAEVLTIAVAIDCRRRGVAATLLETHLSELAMERVRRLFLEVEEGNAGALALYKKFGFVEKGRRDGYYRKADGSRASALIMQKDVI